ncbi:hypothetical protein I5677_07065 [Mobilitalea sibirica]|uniref:SLH domain-containing protein n=1 Tax=Mobilitalea sibirica TaxID=1462919 RepID=A0A8J7KVW8_9FIRM|nr:hypothetical protein [Mobilitalea sibirica]MBH1940645.1 hypothetical protein [Mobilitalea sibirica]
MLKRTMKTMVSVLLTVIMLITSVMITDTKNVSAATTYITVEAFAQALAKEIGLSSVSGTHDGYVNALLEKDIIKEGDFSSYTGNLTRTDAAVLLNRADEYLYGDNIDPKLVELALEKRISDIESIKSSKRTDVVKCYLKGFIKGYSNGEYSSDREFKGSKKITEKGALSCIKLLKDKDGRAQISPDGQLIRTTKLPVYAKYYPYVLASYPNEYYDWQFDFEGQVLYDPMTDTETPYENIKDYAAPVDVDKTTKFEDFPTMKDEYLNNWLGKVKTYMEHVFNADYRTINDKWVDAVLSTDYAYGSETRRERTRKEIEQYVTNMKKNKTIVESSKIAVDGSSLYYFSGDYYLRVYVKYRIVSSEVKFGVDNNTIIRERPYSNILYSNYPLVHFTDYKLGEWRECQFDVRLARYSERAGADLGIFYAYLVEQLYYERRIEK